MPRWAVPALLVLAAVLVIIGLVADMDWLVASVAVLVILSLIAYALTLLAAGQREWFGREQKRREDRP